MVPDSALRDILILEDEIFLYKRKFNKLVGIAHDAYVQGQDIPNEEWLRVWTALMGANKLLQHRWKQCRRVSRVPPIKYLL